MDALKDAGLWVNYSSKDNKMTLLSGPIYAKIDADDVRGWKSSSYSDSQFDGEIKHEKDGFWHVRCSPSWKPSDRDYGSEVLKVEGLKSITIAMIPDSQPEGKPLSLFINGILASQGEREIHWEAPSQSEPETKQVETSSALSDWIEQNKNSVIVGGGVTAAVAVGGYLLSRGGESD